MFWRFSWNKYLEWLRLASAKEYTTLLMLQVAAIEFCCHNVIGYLITIQGHIEPFTGVWLGNLKQHASIKKLISYLSRIYVSVQISSHCEMFNHRTASVFKVYSTHCVVHCLFLFFFWCVELHYLKKALEPKCGSWYKHLKGSDVKLLLFLVNIYNVTMYLTVMQFLQLLLGSFLRHVCIYCFEVKQAIVIQTHPKLSFVQLSQCNTHFDKHYTASFSSCHMKWLHEISSSYGIW